MTSLFFALFVTEVVEGNVFLRKSLMALRLPLFMLAAAYLYTRWPSLQRRRRLLVAMLALAVPTLLSDLYATSQTSDPRFTTYVAPEEMRAASWVRTHTGAAAIVQPLLEYHGVFDYPLIICFGDRPAALGLWGMAMQRYPNRSAITARVHELETMFSTEDAAERLRLVRALHIDYVFIGPQERARFPGADARFAADTLNFSEVYASAGVRIFQPRT